MAKNISNIIDIQISDKGSASINVNGEPMAVVRAVEEIATQLAQINEKVAKALILGVCKSLPKENVEAAVAKAYYCIDLADKIADKIIGTLDIKKSDKSTKAKDTLDKIFKIMGE